MQNRRLRQATVAGTKITREYCTQHALEGMVNVHNRKCRTEGCGKRPSFGVAGTKTGEYCARHALEGMVDVCSIKCRTEGCGKRPFFGVAGFKRSKFCFQISRKVGAKNLEPNLFILTRCDVGFQMEYLQGTPFVLLQHRKRWENQAGMALRTQTGLASKFSVTSRFSLSLSLSLSLSVFLSLLTCVVIVSLEDRSKHLG